jgi:hypothetical protein
LFTFIERLPEDSLVAVRRTLSAILGLGTRLNGT